MGINLSLYKTIVTDLGVGETARVNHDECTAGVDSRRRLYITRPQANPDAVVAYCHNCQMGGYLKTGTHEGYRDRQHPNTSVPAAKIITDTVVPPKDMVEKIGHWPVEAIAWAYKNGLNQDLLDQYHIQYDPTSNRVYLPRYRAMYGTRYQDLMGYQLRNVQSLIRGPKYLTVVKDTDKGFTVLREHSATSPASTVGIIVEDLISGIHVVKAALQMRSFNVVVYINYGTKVQLDLLSRAAGIGNVMVWLDNDSTHVRAQAETMARTIKLIDSKCWTYVEGIACDPKNATYDQIRQHIADFEWAKNAHKI